MKITDNRKTDPRKFGALEVGTMFEFNGIIYIKTLCGGCSNKDVACISCNYYEHNNEFDILNSYGGIMSPNTFVQRNLL